MLALGEVVKGTWDKCAAQLGLARHVYHTWREMVHYWFNKASNTTIKGQLLGIIPSIVTWHLWTHRCKARLENQHESMEEIWRSIKIWIVKVSEKLKVVKPMFRQDEMLLLDFPSKPIRAKLVQVVKWKRPQFGWFKLNVDGSSRENPGATGAGGVIQDDKGKIISSSSLSLGNGTTIL